MSRAAEHRWQTPLSPYRQVPEQSHHMMRVMLAALLLPTAAGTVFFGYHAIQGAASAALAAGLMERLVSRLRREEIPGSMTHSVVMGMLAALTIPAAADWRVFFLAGASAALIGKQVFGGVGHYVWHPALIGRLVAQLVFREELTGSQVLLLRRCGMGWGNIQDRAAESGWFPVNWFSGAGMHSSAVYLLEKPAELLRQYAPGGEGRGFGDFMLEKLPGLGHCIAGAVPGGIGETCGLVLLFAVVYLIYRGYVRWELTALFLGGAYAAAGCFPVIRGDEGTGAVSVWFLWREESFGEWLSYVNYHVFSGDLLLGVLAVSLDMISRPITRKGQMWFGLGAGVLTMAFRLYTEIPIPCYAAILGMNTLTPLLDRMTRPRR